MAPMGLLVGWLHCTAVNKNPGASKEMSIMSHYSGFRGDGVDYESNICLQRMKRKGNKICPMN